MKFLYAVVAAACASLVSAHGVVEVFTADGKDYKGPGPLEEDGPAMPNSPIRRVGANGPVSDVTSPDMACGVGNPPPTGGIATVSAGSDVKFQMSKDWPHEEGPITLYMGKCSDTADKCDSSQVKWFKVDAKGLNDDGTWYQKNIAEGKAGVATIPAGLENGNYLLRYEILALHRAQDIGGAEFFISCTQIQLVNGGSAKPTASELVSFPGAYSATAPGIKVDIYTDFHSYSYPGPPLFDGANGDSGSSGGESSSTSSEPNAPTSTETPRATSTEPSEPTSTQSAEPTSTEPSEPTPTESAEPTTTESAEPTPSTDASEPTSTPTKPSTCKQKRALKQKKDKRALEQQKKRAVDSERLHRGLANKLKTKTRIGRPVVPLQSARRSNVHRRRFTH
ncbi:hypothetical protein EXIGLDRAFT_830087 [Exidia glandulosa HHB12029]|uniref:lytic cellulose monooxygenase (C4-dehydrogenating) n=1 Tax=Exidia glandulosa HHB12029 TaxID=1314781 RepID=A0A165NX51_EXIGL|nr:hypothetical protein EXIGLDRAFT_830087 [Exidia glandulosa HHB12029]